MVLFNRGFIKISILLLLAAAVTVVLFRLSTIVFPSVPEHSETFDCDDSTLVMYRHFEKLGIPSWPIIGNLEKEAEAFSESDHVWLLVKFGDQKIAYDWGFPQLDGQHYEGYIISYDELLVAVDYDLTSQDGYLASNKDKQK